MEDLLESLKEQHHYPKKKTKIIKIVSKGDEIQDKSLQEIGGKGLFIKKLEQALIDNVADIAVHSLKDMEWKETKGLEIAAFLQRGSRKDILISKYKSIYELPKNAKLGTSSVRRKAFILSERPDLNISILRGNKTNIRNLNDSKSNTKHRIKRERERTSQTHNAQKPRKGKQTQKRV